MTDIRNVPIFPGDLKAIQIAIEHGNLSRSDRNLLAQVIERYGEACTCPGSHITYAHISSCPKSHQAERTVDNGTV